MNEFNEKIQNVFRHWLKADCIECSWSISSPVEMVWSVDGPASLGQLRPTTTFLKVRAIIDARQDVWEGTNTLSRLQARNFGKAKLTQYNMSPMLWDGRYLVDFEYYIHGELEEFVTDAEKLIREEYDYEFTKNLEAELSSPNLPK